MLDTIRRYQKDYNYLVCPHGAVACYAADNSQNKDHTRIKITVFTVNLRPR